MMEVHGVHLLGLLPLTQFTPEVVSCLTKRLLVTAFDLQFQFQAHQPHSLSSPLLC